MIELYIKCPQAECTKPPSTWQWGKCKHRVYLCEDGDVRNICNKNKIRHGAKVAIKINSLEIVILFVIALIMKQFELNINFANSLQLYRERLTL
jgi:hypothetical protein